MSAARTQEYRAKFDRIAGQTRFGLLPASEQRFLREKAHEMRFTMQELRQVCDIALDRLRWKEAVLSRDWPKSLYSKDPRQAKKRLLGTLAARHEALKTAEKSYARFDDLDRPLTRRPDLRTRRSRDLGLGRCPVASERTRCCNLMTLDAVQKCGFDCSYCSIQSFYHGNEVVFDSGFADKLERLELDPQQTYHIGTGQSSDSLMWGNHEGILESLCGFARRNANVILELKTKSRNIGWLLRHAVPRNVLCTWSLNPQDIIDHEEHRSAGLEQRLDAAQALAGKGCVVGFHFHPMIWHAGWEAAYRDIADQLLNRFDPRQVAMVSLGTLTFTRSVMNTIRSRDLSTKILQMPLEPCAGKLSYPADLKIRMFRLLYDALEPWHESVFFYLCMEPHALWSRVFGFEYSSNTEFEEAMKNAYRDKIASQPDPSASP